MFLRQDTIHPMAPETDPKLEFGKFLEVLLVENGLKQADIYTQLGWSADKLSLLIRGQRSPLFEDIPLLVRALSNAGVVFTLQGLHQFVALAYHRVAIQKTYKDKHSKEEWEARFRALAAELGLLASRERSSQMSSPQLLETTHLIKREIWRESFLEALEERQRKKLVILRGSPGSGKSSELSWLVMHLTKQKSHQIQVLLHNCRSIEAEDGPKVALRLLLGALLAELGSTLSPESQSRLSLDQQTALLIDRVEQCSHRLIVLVDHAEAMLDEQGRLAVSWERFFSRWLRSAHRAILVVATRQWAGWYAGEDTFVREVVLPPLSGEESIRLLKQLGLQTVPHRLLQEVADRTGGNAQALEWFAALTRQPLATSEWEEIFTPEPERSLSDEQEALSQTVERLLSEPHLFAGSQADTLAPMLERIVENQHLSRDAQILLEVLSLASLPLAQPALAVICPMGTRPIRELRRASLLTTYEHRLHANVVVSSAIVRALTPADKYTREELLIEAYTTWLQGGMCDQREAGFIVADLAVLLLKHHRLLSAAELLLRYGWLAFHLGYTARLAHFASQVIDQGEWEKSEENRCGRHLLYYFLSPFCNVRTEREKQIADYHSIQAVVSRGAVSLTHLTEVYLLRLLTVYAESDHHFEEAQDLLQACSERMAGFTPFDAELQVALLEVQALLWSHMSGALSAQGNDEQAAEYRERVIATYRECYRLLSEQDAEAPLTRIFLKKRLARICTNLGYQLDRVGRYEEALPIIEQSIELKEQGYVEPGSLAASYGEKSQALAAMGRLEEALKYDTLAVDEIERFANAGDTLVQSERWIYLVNRACLYLRLQRVDEAEALLKSTEGKIPRTRKEHFDMLAEQTLTEIKAWREQAVAEVYQYDWRWISRLREATAYNAFWWLAHAGPFTAEEQDEWMRLKDRGNAVQKRLEALVTQSKQRELAAALAEKREPLLWYPAIPLAEVHSRITTLLILEEDIFKYEKNESIRMLYQDAISENLSFLRLIEAAYQQDREKFFAANQQLHPVTTQEEMNYALDRVKFLIRQGLQQPGTRAASQRVLQLVQEQLLLPFDPIADAVESALDQQTPTSLSPARPQQFVSAQAAQRFFEATLHEAGCEGWSVLREATASSPRIESASHLFIIPDRPFSLGEVKSYRQHEVLSHIADVVAGEHSPLGLLSVGTKDYMPISEGLALYHELQLAQETGKAFDDSKVWLGALSAGLAAGVRTAPQSFISLHEFLKAFLTLYRLLRRPDESMEVAQKKAHDLALTLCLRIFRGVPHLEQPGVCYSKDTCYLRGFLAIQQAVAEDPTILDRLSVGRMALRYLPAIERLGIRPSFQSLRQLAQPDLDARILSFENE